MSKKYVYVFSKREKTCNFLKYIELKKEDFNIGALTWVTNTSEI